MPYLELIRPSLLQPNSSIGLQAVAHIVYEV